jgi:tetratricopeptide (TPR) repeat protein
MKDKIKAALQQGHKNLGITDEEVFERVAAAAETFITDEAKISEFVSKAEPMLKLFQSEADKARTAKQHATELEAKLKEKESTPPADEPAPPEKVDINKIVAEAIAAANKSNEELLKNLQTKLDAFEGAQTAKEVIDTAHRDYQNNDYVKGYPDEATEAWERALEINTERGNKMTSAELLEKAMGYFGKAIAKKGADISKPFEGNSDAADSFDADAYRKALERTGRVAAKKQ